ncbi:hypothetical protein GCM10010327_14320 [Streptomyces nitrosporeus]|nr:hypothetical protein GCM10010327_14320 [Streptomyces nitrosporeus]
MARRHERGTRQCRDVEGLRVVAVHRVPGPAQPDKILQRRHPPSLPQACAPAWGVAPPRPSRALPRALSLSLPVPPRRRRGARAPAGSGSGPGMRGGEGRGTVEACPDTRL